MALGGKFKICIDLIDFWVKAKAEGWCSQAYCATWDQRIPELPRKKGGKCSTRCWPVLACAWRQPPENAVTQGVVTLVAHAALRWVRGGLSAVS